jgi:hypothetical protein
LTMVATRGGGGSYGDPRRLCVDASAIKAYYCTARITSSSEIVLTLWVYIYQAQH